MRTKVQDLFKNMGWMTISNFASKILVFLMVPFYTRVLSTDQYGMYDICYTTATLLAPLLTANVAEALMRFALSDKKNINIGFSCSLYLSLIVVLVGSCSGSAFLYFGTAYDDFFITLIGLSFLIFSSDIIYILFSQFARGIDRVKDMALGGLLNSVLLVGLSLVFVLVLNWGVYGCFLATSFSMVVSGMSIGISCRSWKYLDKPNIKYFKQMISYGFPLSINTIGWWMNNAFSRFAVAAMCDLSSAGLLAAAYKIPSIPKVIQQVFVQAWQISAIKEFDKNDEDGFFRKTYDVMCLASSVLTSFVILIMPILAGILFSEEFFVAWSFVPILMLSVVFNCLASVIGGVFLAVGDSKPIATSSLVSVAISVVACVVLVPFLGVQGAAVSSALSSLTIWLMRFKACKQYIVFKVNWKLTFVCLGLLALQITFALFIDLSVFWAVLQAACLVFLLITGLVLVKPKPIYDRIIKRSGK